MADDWISEVNAHSDTDCWCRGTHAEGLHSIWERRRDADQLRAENADLRARLAEVEDDHSRMVEWHDQEHARAEAAEAKLAAVRDRLKTAGVLTIDFAWRDELLALIDEENTVTEPLDTANLRAKWSQWEDAVLDPQSLRCDLLDALDEIDRLREDNADLVAAKDERDNTPFIAHWKARAEAAETKLARVSLILDWMGENNDDAEYDLVLVALNNILEGSGRD
jgi:hypothetical protein